ncbi:MAG TPA: class I adenylate-forming enzyme family protein, partial [Syntrophomonadaceae bacterium]|nr:class I adenylate-forming enzyme family protein [Syntrophomonadaceae bacterium]
MPITEMLSRNARVYGDEISLIERDPAAGTRREISWRQFDDMANSFANALIARGIKKEDKVALLMMNCLEWLPAYFGILKTGALAVPLNFRYTAEEIKKCLETSEAQILVYGPEFIDRINAIKDELNCVENYIFVGSDCPAGAESFSGLLSEFPAADPGIEILDSDLAALYFTSGTTGTPKSILHPHSNLVSACITENRHHLTTHEDNFLCIPPLYHTGAK